MSDQHIPFAFMKAQRFFITNEKTARRVISDAWSTEMAQIRKVFCALHSAKLTGIAAHTSHLLMSKHIDDMMRLIDEADRAHDDAQTDDGVAVFYDAYRTAQLVSIHAKATCDVAVRDARAKCDHNVALTYVRSNLGEFADNPNMANEITYAFQREFDETYTTITSHYQEIMVKYSEIADNYKHKYDELQDKKCDKCCLVACKV